MPLFLLLRLRRAFLQDRGVRGGLFLAFLFVAFAVNVFAR